MSPLILHNRLHLNVLFLISAALTDESELNAWPPSFCLTSLLFFYFFFPRAAVHTDRLVRMEAQQEARRRRWWRLRPSSAGRCRKGNASGKYHKSFNSSHVSCVLDRRRRSCQTGNVIILPYGGTLAPLKKNKQIIYSS